MVHELHLNKSSKPMRKSGDWQVREVQRTLLEKCAAELVIADKEFEQEFDKICMEFQNN